SVYLEFRQNAVESIVWVEPSELRRRTQKLIDDGYFSSIENIGAVTAAVELSRERSIEFADALASVQREDSRNRALSLMDELFEELIEERRIEEYPIYVDRDLKWNFFRGSGREVMRFELLDAGGSSSASGFKFNTRDISIEQPASAVMREYASLLNRRDPFLGFVYYLADDADYAHSIDGMYAENLAAAMLDLIMRSAMIKASHADSQIGGGEALSAEDIEEGIVFMDMDMHDAPTIGAII
ncbi:MAG: hypothetical protein QXP70_06415, partial [Methanomassiliicoccales archaeon]